MPETAALIAVPLPLSTPVIEVVSVIAGVVVSVATVPANPFAETTDAVVTEPVAGVVQPSVACVPDTDEIVKTWLADPIVPGKSSVCDVTAAGAARDTLVVGSVVPGAAP